MTNGNTYQKKIRKNQSFSNAVINKTDVGEFQAGYFVMAEATKENQPHKPKNRTPERYTERHSRPSYQRSHSDLLPREGDSNVSYERITSPSRSPNKNRRSPQHYHDHPLHTGTITSPTSSPNKPRKASAEKRVDNNPHHEHFSLESTSPKDRSPPAPNRWAGPAFSNAPPPSSLPIPEFPPFVSPSSSPPTSQPVSAPIPQPASYTEIYYPPQPLSHPPPLVHYYSYPSPYYVPTTAPSLTQLSMDLRRMLNITETQPIPA